jgi:uncharacterized protein YlzI (FlbEa/FlbD family)
MTNHSDLKAALEAMRADRIPSPAPRVEFLPFITVDLGDGCILTTPPDRIESIYVTPEWARLKLKNGECYIHRADVAGYAAIVQLQATITDIHKGPTL